ncbi:MAG: hypothetical protein HY720_21855 [Planctomycetes bacterium]|nr:hypothetical protein [Planctomycetota bacterium]
MSRRTEWLVVLMLGFVVVLLTILVAQNPAPIEPAYAQSTSMGGERFLIATGLKSSGESVLWVLDAKNETLSVYAAPVGQRLQYVGTRPIKYEVQLKGPLNDGSPREMSYQALKEAFEKQKPEDEGGGGGN